MINFFGKKKKRIFLDYASTTPVDPRVSERMKECEEIFGNPSALYAEALSAKKVLDDSIPTISKILHCRKEEIFFTSGGTESNNLALLGVFEACRTHAFTPHIITTDIEHPSILEVCKEIERRGGEVTYVPVSSDGLVNPQDIAKALRPNTVLVSVMHANNEIGTVQPVHEISRVIQKWRQKNDTAIPYLHTDASQSAAYLSIDIEKLGVDLMTLDGIKMYGPRGFGMLYVNKDVNIRPIIFGGGQQNGLRSGTENISGMAGFAKALEIVEEMKEKESLRLAQLRNYAIDLILKTFPNSTLNGSKEFRLPNNINICFPGLDAEFAVISLDVAGISVSYSSSCRTLAENSSSYVVSALGKKDCALSSLRFTLGRESTESDIDALIVALRKIIK